MSGILAVGFYYWVGAAVTTLAIMTIYAATCLIRKGHLPEYDIPYWQMLRIYLPIQVLPAIVFALTDRITGVAGVFPTLDPSGLSAVSVGLAGSISVLIITLGLSRCDAFQRIGSDRRLLVHRQNPTLLSRLAPLWPVFALFVLPVVLFFCLQLIGVLG